jgi:hypothetical protein
MTPAQLENWVEHLCQYIWNAFTNVSNSTEMKRLLDCLENASVAAESGLKFRAMSYIAEGLERVFGSSSYDYREFMRLYFPERLAWREYIERVNPTLDSLNTITQAEARQIMESVRLRAIELGASL